MKLGMVTIGQAPREDLWPDVRPLLAGVDVIEHGALDPLGDQPSSAALAALQPSPGEAPLTSRLRGGAAVVMGHQALNGLLTDAVRRSEEDGAVATLLLCTGHFEDLPAQRPLLSAEPLVQQGVQALAGNEPVGVVCPLPEQAADVHDRWQQVLPGPITTAPASPYTNDDDALRSAASTLAAAGSTLLVLDCIGYTEHMRTLVARASGLPVLLARTLAVRLAVEQVSAGN